MATTRSKSKQNGEKRPLLQKKGKAAESAASVKPLEHKSDNAKIALLIILYLLQGIPLGLSMGSVPFLLKSKLNFSELALFSLSAYPYSLKLFWSPLVDSIYWKGFGRRKSWIIPMQILLGLCMLAIGSVIDEMLELEEIPIMMIAGIFTLMVLLCATQDIAVDGWAISLLTDENKAFASTAQTIGLNTGFFLSFTVLLALSSPEFPNSYLRSEPLDVGLFTLGGYLIFWGAAFLLCTVGLLVVPTDDPVEEEEESISSVYQTIWNICKLPHMQSFIAVMLIAKIGFQANEAVTGLKLLEKGFNKEYLALAVLLDFPLQLVVGYYAAKWSSGKNPLLPWTVGFWGRLFAAMGAMVVVQMYPEEGVTTSYFLVVMLATILSSFFNTLQFVSMGSFFLQISDPSIGGTYMTLLNTISNLGGTWPKYFILLAVEHYTEAPCSVLSPSGLSIKCSDDKSKEHCAAYGGSCSYVSDGYYVVNTACFLFGFATLLFYIQPAINRLQRVPTADWRIAKDDVATKKVN